MHAYAAKQTLFAKENAIKISGVVFIAFWAVAAIAYAAIGPAPKYEVPIETVHVPFKNHGPSLGDISYKQQIEINGEKRLLFPTFDDPDKAIEEISSKCPHLLGYLHGRKLILGPLSKSNAAQYQELMTQILDSDNCPDWYGEQDDEFLLLRSFFDIFENDAENAELIKTAQQHGLDAIAYSLPYEYHTS